MPLDLLPTKKDNLTMFICQKFHLQMVSLDLSPISISSNSSVNSSNKSKSLDKEVKKLNSAWAF